MNISINPAATNNAAGTFNTSSVGLIQGMAYPDPETRYSLAGGVLSTNETLPMWGGIGIYEDVPGASGGPVPQLGSVVGRATGLTGSKIIRGFSVFNQAYGMVNSPNSPVPLVGNGGQVMYHRLGSGARIAVACDPLLASLISGDVGANVSWDFVNQLLVPYLGTLTISSGTYNNTTGVITLTMAATVAFSAGDALVLSSLTGTGAFASLDGTWTVLTTSGTTATLQGPVGVGASTITGGSATLGSGASQALPVKVLDINTTNSITVSYNASTGFATWNYNGSAAVILL